MNRFCIPTPQKRYYGKMSPSRCNARQTAAFSPDSREGLPTGRYGRAESLPHLFRADCTAPSSKKRGNGSPPPAGIPASSVYVSYPELSSPAASRTCHCSRHIPTCATHHRGCLGKRRAQPWGIRQTGTKGKRGMFAISALSWCACVAVCVAAMAMTGPHHGRPCKTTFMYIQK